LSKTGRHDAECTLTLLSRAQVTFYNFFILTLLCSYLFKCTSCLGSLVFSWSNSQLFLHNSVQKVTLYGWSPTACGVSNFPLGHSGVSTYSYRLLGFPKGNSPQLQRLSELAFGAQQEALQSVFVKFCQK